MNLEVTSCCSVIQQKRYGFMIEFPLNPGALGHQFWVCPGYYTCHQHDSNFFPLHFCPTNLLSSSRGGGWGAASRRTPTLHFSCHCFLIAAFPAWGTIIESYNAWRVVTGLPGIVFYELLIFLQQFSVDIAVGLCLTLLEKTQDFDCVTLEQQLPL